MFLSVNMECHPPNTALNIQENKYDEEKKKSALYKYDRLEDILSAKPSMKNFNLLLLMLIGDGNNSLEIEKSLPEEYKDEYNKVLKKINSRIQRKH